MYDTVPEAKPEGAKSLPVQVPRRFPAPFDDLEQKFFCRRSQTQGCRIGNSLVQKSDGDIFSSGTS